MCAVPLRKDREEDEVATKANRRAADPDWGQRVAPDLRPVNPAMATAMQRSVGNATLGRMIAQGPAGPRVPHAAPSTRKRTQDEVVERGESPPASQQKTEAGAATRATRSGKAGATPSVKGKEGRVEEEIGNPTLVFTSSYDGDEEQSLNGNNNIGFAQTATLRRADGMQTPAAEAYDFWQEVSDESRQIVPTSVNYQPKKAPRRAWGVDGPFRPPYNEEDGNIIKAADRITFVDNPGFSTTTRMSAGYFLVDYTVRFRWKVRKKQGGRFTKAEPFWESDEMVHRVTSAFDAENPEEAVQVNHHAAGNRTWNVQLPN
ncbi:hypothetical protein AB0B78_35115 [Streptomyces sp. NPDC040724]|uniref:hypothetical protein n=1 Tax=Streptomyces sp. NPDC040724 TaxID=3155612 RepID=UPI0033C8C90F